MYKGRRFNKNGRCTQCTKVLVQEMPRRKNSAIFFEDYFSPYTVPVFPAALKTGGKRVNVSNEEKQRRTQRRSSRQRRRSLLQLEVLIMREATAHFDADYHLRQHPTAVRRVFNDKKSAVAWPHGFHENIPRTACSFAMTFMEYAISLAAHTTGREEAASIPRGFSALDISSNVLKPRPDIRQPPTSNNRDRNGTHTFHTLPS